MHIHTCIYLHTHVYVYIYMYLKHMFYIYVHTHTHMNIYIYIHLNHSTDRTIRQNARGRQQHCHEQQQAIHFSQAPRVTKSLSPADRESGCAQPELGSARGNLMLAVTLLAERL